MNEWSFETINGIPEYAVSNHVFFHPSLIEAWMKTYAPLRKLTPILIKGISSSNEAYMPLVHWRMNWKNAFVNIIVPIGYSDFDYHDPIFIRPASDEAKRKFWIELIDFLGSTYSYDRLCIDGITDSVAIGDKWQQGEICPLLHLDNIHTEDELMAFFKTSLRGDIRRQIRRLNEIGDLRYVEYDSWDKIPQATFAEFMAQHSFRWPNAYKAPHFHENLLQIGLKANVAHFSTLFVGDTEIAWHLGFSYHGQYYYYMPVGNRDYSKFSPTKIHLYYLVRRAVEQGYRVFDHLRGEENYKTGWSNDSQFVNSIDTHSNGAISLIKEGILRLRRKYMR